MFGLRRSNSSSSKGNKKSDKSSRTPSLTESAIKAVANEEEWEDMEGKSEIRSRVSSRTDKKSSKKSRSRSASRERKSRKSSSDKRDSDRRRDRQAESTAGSSRSAREDRARGSDSTRARANSSSLSQFPGQYDQSFGSQQTGQRPLPQHIQSQFPGQFPTDYAHGAYMEAGQTTSEGGYGLAASYYGDQGQSVANQPGVRPPSPELKLHHPPHLQPASATPQPAQDTGSGAAAEYFGSSATAAKPSQPSQPPRPDGPSAAQYSYDQPGPSTGVSDAASFYTAPVASSTWPQMASGTGQYAPGPGETYYAAPHQPPHPGQSSSGRIPTAAVAGAAGLAAAAYATHSHGQSHPTVGPGYPQEDQYPSRPPPTTGQSQSHAHRHKHRGPLDRLLDLVQNKEDVRRMEEYTEYIGVCKYCFDPKSSPREAPRPHHYHRRRSSDSFKRRRSNESLRRSARRQGRSGVDKDARYYSSSSSSDSGGKRKSKAGWLGAGLAGYGIAKMGNALWNQKHDFDDTSTVKTGRSDRPPSYRSKHSDASLGVIRPDGQTEYVYSRNPDALTVRHPEPRRRSRSRSGGRRSDVGGPLHSGIANPGSPYMSAPHAGYSHGRTAQNPRTVAQGAFVRKHSRSRSRSHSPGLGEIFGLSSSRRKRKSSSPRRTKSKQKGFFSFSNSSSSSSDSGLGNTNRSGSRKHSSPRVKKRNSKDHLDATLLGIGATAAALAAAQGRRRPDVAAARDRIDKNRIRDRGAVLGKQYSGDEDGWEDASDSEGSSVSSGLAFGDLHYDKGKAPARRSSRDSLASDSSGTGKWGWRWGGSSKRKDRPSAAPVTTRPSMPMFDERNPSHASPAQPTPIRPSEVASVVSSAAMGPMQFVDPMPLQDSPSVVSAQSRYDSPRHQQYSHPPQYPVDDSRRPNDAFDFSRRAPDSRRDHEPRDRPLPSRAQTDPSSNHTSRDAAILGGAAVAAAGLYAATRSRKDDSSVRFEDEKELRKGQRDQRKREEREAQREAEAERERAREHERTRGRREDAERRAYDRARENEQQAIADRAEHEAQYNMSGALPSPPSGVTTIAPYDRPVTLSESERQLEVLIAQKEKELAERKVRETAASSTPPPPYPGYNVPPAASSQPKYDPTAGIYTQTFTPTRRDTEDEVYSPDTPEDYSRGRTGVEHSQAARTTAAKVVADLKEKYTSPQPTQAEFFAPKDLDHEPLSEEERRKAYSKAWVPNGDADIHYTMHAGEYKRFDPRTQVMLRKDGVPHLGLIVPTPPISTAGSVRGDKSPISPQVVSEKESPKEAAQRVRDEKAANRVSWGPDDTRFYEIESPAHSPRIPPAGSFPAEVETPMEVNGNERGERGTTSYKFSDLPAASAPLIADTFRREPEVIEAIREDPHMSSNARGGIYQSPFFETVSDLGLSLDSPGTEGAPPVRGFIEGEVDDLAPVVERSPSIPGSFDESGSPPAVSRDTKPTVRESSRAKAYQEKAVDREPMAESWSSLPTKSAAREETDFDTRSETWDTGLSKKDRKKRDKASKRDIVDFASEPAMSERAESIVGEPSMRQDQSLPEMTSRRADEGFVAPKTKDPVPVEDVWEKPLSKKELKKREKLSRRNTDEVPSDVAETPPITESKAMAEEDSFFEAPLTKKEKRRREKLARQDTDEYADAMETPAPAETLDSSFNDIPATVPVTQDEWQPPLSKKEQKRRDKLARQNTDDIASPAETAALTIEAKDDDEWQVPLSKKEQKKRDKLSRQGIDNYASPLEAPVTSVETKIDDEWQVPLSKKEQKKRDKLSRQGTDDYASPLEAPVTSVETKIDDEWQVPLSKKEQKKRDKLTRQTTDDYASPLEAPVTAVETKIDDEWQVPLSKKEQKKRDKLARQNTDDFGTPTETPIVEPPRAEDAWDIPLSRKEQKRREKLARQNTDDAIPAASLSESPTKLEEEPAWEAPLSKKDRKKLEKERRKSYADEKPVTEDRYDREDNSPSGSGDRSKHDGDERESRSDRGDKSESKKSFGQIATALLTGGAAGFAVNAATKSGKSSDKRDERGRDGDRHSNGSHQDEQRHSGVWSPPRYSDDNVPGSIAKGDRNNRVDEYRAPSDSPRRESTERSKDLPGSFIDTERPETEEERRARKKKSRHSGDFDDTMSMVSGYSEKSSRSKRDKDESSSKKEKRGGLLGMFRRKSEDTGPLDEPDSRDDKRDKKHHRRRGTGDDDDTRSVTSGISRRSTADYGDVPEPKRERRKDRRQSDDSPTDELSRQSTSSKEDLRKRERSATVTGTNQDNEDQSFLAKRVEVEELRSLPAEPSSLPSQAPETAAKSSASEESQKSVLPEPQQTPHQEPADVAIVPGSSALQSMQSPSSETPKRPLPIPVRPSSATSVPIRFRRPPASPSSPDSPASLITPRTRTSRPRSTEIRREFQPLYLVEHNRKPSELVVENEPLPPLPISRETSRASSLRGSDGYESAVEDQVWSEAVETPLPAVEAEDEFRMFDQKSPEERTWNLNVQDEDVLGSGQSTPRATTFPANALGGRKRAEPEFYSWEDMLREEQLRAESNIRDPSPAPVANALEAPHPESASTTLAGLDVSTLAGAAGLGVGAVAAAAIITEQQHDDNHDTQQTLDDVWDTSPSPTPVPDSQPSTAPASAFATPLEQPEPEFVLKSSKKDKKSKRKSKELKLGTAVITGDEPVRESVEEVNNRRERDTRDAVEGLLGDNESVGKEWREERKRKKGGRRTASLELSNTVVPELRIGHGDAPVETGPVEEIEIEGSLPSSAAQDNAGRANETTSLDQSVSLPVEEPAGSSSAPEAVNTTQEKAMAEDEWSIPSKPDKKRKGKKGKGVKFDIWDDEQSPSTHGLKQTEGTSPGTVVESESRGQLEASASTSEQAAAPSDDPQLETPSKTLSKKELKRLQKSRQRDLWSDEPSPAVEQHDPLQGASAPMLATAELSDPTESRSQSVNQAESAVQSTDDPTEGQFTKPLSKKELKRLKKGKRVDLWAEEPSQTIGRDVPADLLADRDTTTHHADADIDTAKAPFEEADRGLSDAATRESGPPEGGNPPPAAKESSKTSDYWGLLTGAVAGAGATAAALVVGAKASPEPNKVDSPDRDEPSISHPPRDMVDVVAGSSTNLDATPADEPIAAETPAEDAEQSPSPKRSRDKSAEPSAKEKRSKSKDEKRKSATSAVLSWVLPGSSKSKSEKDKKSKRKSSSKAKELAGSEDDAVTTQLQDDSSTALAPVDAEMKATEPLWGTEDVLRDESDRLQGPEIKSKIDDGNDTTAEVTTDQDTLDPDKRDGNDDVSVAAATAARDSALESRPTDYSNLWGEDDLTNYESARLRGDGLEEELAHGTVTEAVTHSTTPLAVSTQVSADRTSDTKPDQSTTTRDWSQPLWGAEDVALDESQRLTGQNDDDYAMDESPKHTLEPTTITTTASLSQSSEQVAPTSSGDQIVDKNVIDDKSGEDINPQTRASEVVGEALEQSSGPYSIKTTTSPFQTHEREAATGSEDRLAETEAAESKSAEVLTSQDASAPQVMDHLTSTTAQVSQDPASEPPAEEVWDFPVKKARKGKKGKRAELEMSQAAGTKTSTAPLDVPDVATNTAQDLPSSVPAEVVAVEKSRDAGTTSEPSFPQEPVSEETWELPTKKARKGKKGKRADKITDNIETTPDIAGEDSSAGTKVIELSKNEATVSAEVEQPTRSDEAVSETRMADEVLQTGEPRMSAEEPERRTDVVPSPHQQAEAAPEDEWGYFVTKKKKGKKGRRSDAFDSAPETPLTPGKDGEGLAPAENSQLDVSNKIVGPASEETWELPSAKGKKGRKAARAAATLATTAGAAVVAKDKLDPTGGSELNEVATRSSNTSELIDPNISRPDDGVAPQTNEHDGEIKDVAESHQPPEQPVIKEGISPSTDEPLERMIMPADLRDLPPHPKRDDGGSTLAQGAEPTPDEQPLECMVMPQDLRDLPSLRTDVPAEPTVESSVAPTPLGDWAIDPLLDSNVETPDEMWAKMTKRKKGKKSKRGSAVGTPLTKEVELPTAGPSIGDEAQSIETRNNIKEESDRVPPVGSEGTIDRSQEAGQANVSEEETRVPASGGQSQSAEPATPVKVIDVPNLNEFPLEEAGLSRFKESPPRDTEPEPYRQQSSHVSSEGNGGIIGVDRIPLTHAPPELLEDERQPLLSRRESPERSQTLDASPVADQALQGSFVEPKDDPLAAQDQPLPTIETVDEQALADEGPAFSLKPSKKDRKKAKKQKRTTLDLSKNEQDTEQDVNVEAIQAAPSASEQDTTTVTAADAHAESEGIAPLPQTRSSAPDQFRLSRPLSKFDWADEVEAAEKQEGVVDVQEPPTDIQPAVPDVDNEQSVVPRSVAMIEPLDESPGRINDVPAADPEEEFTFTKKVSKKEKRKAKKGKVLSSEVDSLTDPTSTVNPSLPIDSSPSKPEQPVQDPEMMAVPTAATESRTHHTGSPSHDIDFAATLAAGLAQSGFDSNMVIDDPAFHRRSSPPGTVAEIDPEEAFAVVNKKGRKGKKGRKTLPETSRDEIDEVATTGAPEGQIDRSGDKDVSGTGEAGSIAREDDDFAATLAAGLGAAGFSAALLSRSQEELSKANDPEEESFMERKYKKRKDKTAGRSEDLGLEDGKARKAIALAGNLSVEDSMVEGDAVRPAEDDPIEDSRENLPSHEDNSGMHAVIAGESSKPADDDWALPSKSKRGKGKAKGAKSTTLTNEAPRTETSAVEPPPVVTVKAGKGKKKKRGSTFDWSADATGAEEVSNQPAISADQNAAQDNTELKSVGRGLVHTSEVSQSLPKAVEDLTAQSKSALGPQGQSDATQDASTAASTNAPGWSFDVLDQNRDSGVPESPTLPSEDKVHEAIRDSGYDTITDRSNRNSGEKYDPPETIRETGMSDVNASQVSVASWENWELPNKKSRSREDQKDEDSPSGRVPTPVESTTKNRTSYLFSTPPTEDVRNRHAEDLANKTKQDRSLSPTSQDVMPADYVPRASSERKRTKTSSDVGSPVHDVKITRRTDTPKQSFRERIDSSSRPPPGKVLSEDAKGQHPSSQTRMEALRSPGFSNVSTTSLQRLKSPDPIRAPSITASIISNESATPSLRRTDRSASGDLRSAARRGEASDLGRSTPSQTNNSIPPFRPPPTPPLNDDEYHVRNTARAMSDNVFEGYGDGEPMATSPTRPQSIRRKQSMYISDMEARVEALVAENKRLQESRGEMDVDGSMNDEGSARQALATSEMRLREKDAEINQIRAMLEPLKQELERLKDLNDNLTEANRNLIADTNDRYGTLQEEHSYANSQWQQSVRELEKLRHDHAQLSNGMESIVRQHIDAALEDKDTEIARLRAELDYATSEIRSLQARIQATASDDYLTVRDEDYFDATCQKLCQSVQAWVLRFSKSSDNRACRLSSDIKDDKLETRLDNTMLDGSDVDTLLVDRVRRRDVFMALVMMMVWEYIFTRYMFGMDREQRQKLKTLEKILLETGPPRAVAQWRATTLTLLSRRPAFSTQKNLDHEAVTQEIYSTLAALLPPPKTADAQLLAGLKKVLRLAIDLSVEMRTQRADYFMLPPPTPEYDSNGDLVGKTRFDAATMNERSGEYASNEELQDTGSIVKIVLFPLVMKKGDDSGEGGDETVITPAQVLVATSKHSKRVVRRRSGVMDVDEESRGTGARSRMSLVSGGGDGYI
ncbi:hypothetical protein CAC42_1554 [Sphaceloma murrayae]|uniref:Involucrin repeat protein n=1 Tax=Sphaceloma murrayae TaxID=2082308 RepID=A0A2K1R332_9PEZI|nr:hypothetical protein CAC42_1554 [Sphaceloma murrayae]